MTLLQMSGMGTVLIALTLLLRRMAGQKLPPGCYLALWALAALRLLVPVQIASSFSVYNLLGLLTQATSPQTMSAELQITAIHTGTYGWMEAGSALPMSAHINWLAVVWLAGAVCTLLYLLRSHWQCRRWYATSLPMDNAFVRAWQREHRLHRAWQVRQSQLVHTPLTYGLVHPVILIPSRIYSDEELDMILLHEWNHIRHLDVLWQWALVLLCAVHWFNPAVWIMHLVCRQDLELRCDSATARQLSGGQNRQYAMLLLAQAAVPQNPSPLFSSLHLTDYQCMEERMQMIMKPKKLTWKVVVLTLVLLCIGGVAFATSAQESGSSLAANETANVGAFVWPVQAENVEVTLEYGVRVHPVTGEEMKLDHIVLAVRDADSDEIPIVAAADGVVRSAGFNSKEGYHLLIAHGEQLDARYGHCASLLVEAGDTVKAGQPIAIMGSTGEVTGPCLSFAVYQEGESCNPMDWLEADN